MDKLGVRHYPQPARPPSRIKDQSNSERNVKLEEVEFNGERV